MPAPLCSEEEFIDLYGRIGPKQLSVHLGCTERTVHARRKEIEKRRGVIIRAPDMLLSARARPPVMTNSNYGARQHYQCKNGYVLIGSDAHYWPNYVSTAHRAFVHLCKKLKPKIVILNGDMFDGAGISRHPDIGWESKPSVIEELETVTERLDEIEKAAKSAEKVWTLGNHDARFETRLAAAAPEYAEVKGFHLRDHFPLWQPCWSAWINDDVVVKHRFKGGIHATHNNALWAGKTMVTGHLHSLKVTPFADYNGNRFGVDTGTMADPNGPQFMNYTEDSPKNHRQGFIVLRFVDGRLLWPMVVHVLDEGLVEFNGDLIEV